MTGAAPLFLVGFMGSGKSAVGGALAGLLGWEFVDLDRRIERDDGRSVERIFRESGFESPSRDSRKHSTYAPKSGTFVG